MLYPEKVSDSYNHYFEERNNVPLSLNRILIAAEKKEYLADEHCSYIVNTYINLFAQTILSYESSMESEEELRLEVYEFRENMIANYFFILETYLQSFSNNPFQALEMLVKDNPYVVWKAAQKYFSERIEKLEQQIAKIKFGEISKSCNRIIKGIHNYFEKLKKIQNGCGTFKMEDSIERWIYPLGNEKYFISSVFDLQEIVNDLEIEQSIVNHFAIENVKRMLKENYLDDFLVNVSQMVVFAYATASMYQQEPENLEILNIPKEIRGKINITQILDILRNGKIKFSEIELSYIERFFPDDS